MSGENLFCLSVWLVWFGFRAAPAAYGSSQARGLARERPSYSCRPLPQWLPAYTTALAGPHHSHSSVGSEPCLQPTPQLAATPDPQPTQRGQGSMSSWVPVGFITAEPQGELPG